MTELLDLTIVEIIILAVICFGAGLVRGFSGFALSALVMSGAVLILPPVQLLPICWFLELSASLLMGKGGWQEADRKLVYVLVITSGIGAPLGLALTTSVDVEISKLLALGVIMTLSALQLANVQIPSLASKPGTFATGFVAGIISGIASVGGLVIALYVLASRTPARQMRAALVLFLFLSSAISMFWLIWFDVLTLVAFLRGCAFALPAMIGVWAGMQLFTPRFEKYYRPFCLTLLCGLSAFGLFRLSLS